MVEEYTYNTEGSGFKPDVVLPKNIANYYLLKISYGDILMKNTLVSFLPPTYNTAIAFIQCQILY